MQTGWMHSYGSLNTHHDIWFEEWNYTTDDENNNGIDDIITIGYNPDTSCNCTVEIDVWMQVYNDTGSFVYGQDYDHEINGTEEDWFETDVLPILKEMNPNIQQRVADQIFKNIE